MKKFLAYIRVSTTKQGERGSSLQEQRAAIEGYAKRNGLEIGSWVEEQETAAKEGRRLFNRMIADLNKGTAHGVIIHKIDRSARNLRDWASLGELMDRGIEVHFAHESVDLSSRGGRLSADIQAVVAADYIRNLKEEVRKGFYGRLKQGIYPLPAPLGYRDEGGGVPKSIDPVRGPLITLAFNLYATGKYGLETLGEELYRRGLRNTAEKRVSVSGLSVVLNNEFYKGIIRLKKSGERFAGKHEPLVRASVFDHVQEILDGRTKNLGLKHNYQYRKAVHCASCGRVLIPEQQKGHVYYRCHGKACGECVREEALDEGITNELAKLVLRDNEISDFLADYRDYYESINGNREREKEALRLRLSGIESRLVRLTDAYVDRLIEKDMFEERKASVLNERAHAQEALGDLESGRGGIDVKLAQVLELLKSLQNKEKMENQWERRDLIKTASSNLVVKQKSLVVSWLSPFDVIAERQVFDNGAPRRGTCRTKRGPSSRLFRKVVRRLTRDAATRRTGPSFGTFDGITAQLNDGRI